MDETRQDENPEDINPLLIPLLAAIETGMNQVLAMDQETFQRLARFKGRVIAFYFNDLEQTLYFFPDADGIQVLSHYEGEADTVISGSLLAFARMAMAEEKHKSASVFQGRYWPGSAFSVAVPATEY